MFKLALDAGHGKNTAGKRCDKSLDPKETREWVLNSRICDKIEDLLKDYEGYDLWRVDDVTGAKDIPLSTRTANANKFKVDLYLSMHHNAGIKKNGVCGTGGGVVAFRHPKSGASTKSWETDLYNAIIKYTGLKGNRATPIATADFQVLRETNMDAVLIEAGFMDSKTDVPIILTDDFAAKVAKACVEVIVKKGGLTKKKTTTQTATTKLYRVQVGSFSKKSGAETLKAKLKADGYDAIIVETTK